MENKHLHKKPLFVSDIFTEFEFDKFSNQDEIDDSVKLDYIKEMIVLSKSDKQSVLMYIIFALATVGFLVDKLSTAVAIEGHWFSIPFYIGITLLLISALFFFTYWRKIHKLHINLVSCIPKLNIEKSRDLWINLWNEHRRYFKFGLLLLSCGVFISFLIIIILKMR